LQHISSRTNVIYDTCQFRESPSHEFSMVDIFILAQLTLEHRTAKSSEATFKVQI
jgi:hypothetical protein